MAKKIERIHDGDTQVLTRNKTKRPPLYGVILHNDHFTTREFVVGILIRFFQKSEISLFWKNLMRIPTTNSLVVK